MLQKRSSVTSKIGLVLVCILLFSLFPKSATGFYDVDVPHQNPEQKIEQSTLISFQPTVYENPIKRYIVFGPGPVSDITSKANNVIYGVNSKHGSFVVGVFRQNEVSTLQLQGYNIIEDLPLEFNSIKPDASPNEVSRIGKILGSDKIIHKYGYTGNGIKIGIVDTGTDFSNPDMKDSVARDERNIPVMIDADGQGLVLTNATFVANINSKDVIQNYTKPLPKNATSSVYVNSQGVFLNIKKAGKGTSIQVFNSLYPRGGNFVLNGTISDDYKIGKDARHFIVSKSGIYHFGMIYESAMQGQFFRLQLVPVLVVDSITPGLYDTVIPDMSDSWKDFTRFDRLLTIYDFDFTDETRVILGNGKEYLVYDSNRDGKSDYSAGMVGAHVLDVYGTITNSSMVDKRIGAVNGTLLPPLDPKGNFFGIMYDFAGHGTGTAASIVSSGKEDYVIYGNSTKYHIKGIAPEAKIVPIKALWLGDAIYGWLWAAGFDQEKSSWKFTGKPRVDILSNSWGISTFPALQSVPGLDVQSLLLSSLNVPGSLDKNYPGILVVSSAGNAGPGYGTLGTPDAAPFGLTVGAVTDNVYVGYGPFKNQPRFGNSTSDFGEVSGFSSKGPSVIGDPKPDLMGVGEYSFTPTSVTKFSKNMTEPFALFGGTSLAAPLVAGSAAILMQSLKDKGIPYDPFTVKNILTSTASDMGNDPYTQGSGLVNVTNAVNFVLGNDDVFVVYNDASYSNIKKVLDSPLRSMNSSSVGLKQFQLTNSSLPQTSWFGGRINPGDRTSASFTIVNPTNHTIDIQILPQKLELNKISQYNGTTEPRLQDPLIQKLGVYRPDYIPLAEIKNHTSLISFFEKTKPIPDDTSLMILDLTFPFSQFMNSSAKTYADDLKISSLYLYDWNKKNNDTKPSYQELSLINRGGSWGTVQELRVTDPNSKIKHIPLAGVYPVPTRYSYWTGDTKHNSTSFDYTVTASYYKKVKWDEVWLDSNSIQVKPHSTANLQATLLVPFEKSAGLYEGFIVFKGKSHAVNVPVSYAVIKKLQPKDLPTVIEGTSGDTLFGNGYVGGGFDMSNRYNAGNWREYYFDVKDSTVNSVAMNISWKDPDTNLSVFVADPQGRIIQTNVPPGVLGQFQGWPTGDWLGPSPVFSEGGGFYPIKNKDATSTVLYAPINETGVYSVLIHTTLFGGHSVAEPVTITTKFSTILPNEAAPQIKLDLPQFVNSTYKIIPQIIGKNIQDEKYYLDSGPPQIINQTTPTPAKNLSEGEHSLKVVVTDSVGHTVSSEYKFIVDNTTPKIISKSLTNGSGVSGVINLDFDMDELNPAQKNWFTVKLANQTVYDSKTFQFDTRLLKNGQYTIEAIAKDRAGNVGVEKITLNVDNSGLNAIFTQNGANQNFVTLIEIVGGLAIASSISVITFKKFRISKRS